MYCELKRIALSLLLLAATLTVAAQEKITDRLQRPMPGKGTVIIHQDRALYNLLGKITTPAASGTRIQARGYRVQIYAGGNTRAAREAALRAASTIRSYFPDLSIYTEFVSPRWVCRVGDCRTYEEANSLLRDIRATGTFKELTILPNQVINIEL